MGTRLRLDRGIFLSLVRLALNRSRRTTLAPPNFNSPIGAKVMLLDIVTCGVRNLNSVKHLRYEMVT